MRRGRIRARVAGFAAVSPRVFATVALLLVAGFAPQVGAQGSERAAGDAGTSAAFSGGDDAVGTAVADENIEVDPISGRRYRTVRPEGLRRGALAVDTVVPLVLAAALAIFAGVALARAMRGKRK